MIKQVKNIRQNHETFSVKSMFFFFFVCSAAWVPFFNLYLKDLGFTNLKIGMISGTLSFSTIIFTITWGYFADKFGRKTIILVLMITSSLLFWGFLFEGGFWFFFLFTFVFSMFFSPVGAIMDSFGVEQVNKTARGSFGHFRMWSSIGWALNSLIMGFIIDYYKDTSLIFPVASIILVITWLIVLFGFNNYPTSRDTRAQINLSNYVKILRNKEMAIVLAVLFLYGIVSIPLFHVFNLYLEEIGATKRMIGLIFLTQAICEFPLFTFGDKIIKRFGTNRVFLFAILTSSLRMMVYSLTNNPVVPLVLSAVHGVSYSLFIVSAVDYMRKLLPPAWTSTGQSLIWSVFMGAGMTVGYLWVGFLSDQLTMKKAVMIESFSGIGLFLITWLVFRFYLSRKVKSKGDLN